MAGSADPDSLLHDKAIKVALVPLIAMSRARNEMMPREGLLTAADHAGSFHTRNTNKHVRRLPKICYPRAKKQMAAGLPGGHC